MAATVPPIATIQLLNDLNYEDWSFRVKVSLLAEDVWDVVEATTEPPKPEDGEADFRAWRRNNAKALLSIQTCCGDDAYRLIKGIPTAKAAWDALAAWDAGKLKPSHDEERGRHNNNNGESSNVNYDSLYDSLKRGDWDAANEFISRDPTLLKHRSSSNGGTALHEAIKWKRLNIVENLVQLMAKEDLEIKDRRGLTAFYYALTRGMDKIVRSMVQKNGNLVTMRFRTKDGDKTPVVMAHTLEHNEIARFLYSCTRSNGIQVLTEDNDGQDGAELLCQCFFYRRNFDIGWDLFQHNPKLAFTKGYFSGQSPLYALADSRWAFPSGVWVSLRFWQRSIYKSISVQPQLALTNVDEVSLNLEIKLEDDKRNQRDCISLVMSFFQGVKNLPKLLGIHGLYEMKLDHARCSAFLECMSRGPKSINLDSTQVDLVQKAIFRAVQRGHVEFIKQMCQGNPKTLRMKDGRDRTTFQYAVECRQEKVFSLIYGLSKDDQNSFLKGSDKFHNTILHVAGSLSALGHLKHIQGAALQMQRELQWFKEVSNLLPSQFLDTVNVPEKMTAREVFTRDHKELMKKGEESMKGTATSCTVVGALIVTIMFAAAFTVPGGNNQDTGFPMFLRKKFFIVFLIADSISLFSSTISVMIFLGILTSRYAEEDFLWSLPTKMILGLFTLFLSVAAMMVAFSSTLFIMLEGETWVSIPIFLLASVPIISFVWMQFPLCLDIFMFTYGRGIFDKKCRAWNPYNVG